MKFKVGPQKDRDGSYMASDQAVETSQRCYRGLEDLQNLEHNLFWDSGTYFATI